jgi:hypothetical protein
MKQEQSQDEDGGTALSLRSAVESLPEWKRGGHAEQNNRCNDLAQGYSSTSESFPHLGDACVQPQTATKNCYRAKKFISGDNYNDRGHSLQESRSKTGAALASCSQIRLPEQNAKQRSSRSVRAFDPTPPGPKGISEHGNQLFVAAPGNKGKSSSEAQDRPGSDGRKRQQGRMSDCCVIDLSEDTVAESFHVFGSSGACQGNKVGSPAAAESREQNFDLAAYGPYSAVAIDEAPHAASGSLQQNADYATYDPYSIGIEVATPSHDRTETSRHQEKDWERMAFAIYNPLGTNLIACNIKVPSCHYLQDVNNEATFGNLLQSDDPVDSGSGSACQEEPAPTAFVEDVLDLTLDDSPDPSVCEVVLDKANNNCISDRSSSGQNKSSDAEVRKVSNVGDHILNTTSGDSSPNKRAQNIPVRCERQEEHTRIVTEPVQIEWQTEFTMYTESPCVDVRGHMNDIAAFTKVENENRSKSVEREKNVANTETLPKVIHAIEDKDVNDQNSRRLLMQEKEVCKLSTDNTTVAQIGSITIHQGDKYSSMHSHAKPSPGRGQSIPAVEEEIDRTDADTENFAHALYFAGLGPAEATRAKGASEVKKVWIEMRGAGNDHLGDKNDLKTGSPSPSFHDSGNTAGFGKAQVRREGRKKTNIILEAREQSTEELRSQRVEEKEKINGDSSSSILQPVSLEGKSANASLTKDSNYSTRSHHTIIDLCVSNSNIIAGTVTDSSFAAVNEQQPSTLIVNEEGVVIVDADGVAGIRLSEPKPLVSNWAAENERRPDPTPARAFEDVRIMENNSVTHTDVMNPGPKGRFILGMDIPWETSIGVTTASKMKFRPKGKPVKRRVRSRSNSCTETSKLDESGTKSACISEGRYLVSDDPTTLDPESIPKEDVNSWAESRFKGKATMYHQDDEGGNRPRLWHFNSQKDALDEQNRLLNEAAKRVREKTASSSGYFAYPPPPPLLFQQNNKRSKPGPARRTSHPAFFGTDINRGLVFHAPVVDVANLPVGHWLWKDPYSRLGVPPLFDRQNVIKKHYRKLALLYHPDKSRNSDGPRRFQAIKEAYEEIQAQHDW